MINKLKKYVTALIVSTCLITPSQPLEASTPVNNIELVTALLRGPAACLEFKLRNDYSRSAYFKRAVIHAIRLINNCCTSSKHDPSYSIAFDSISVAISLIETGITPENNQVQAKTCLGDDYAKLGMYVLPILEMLCALVRTRQISPKTYNYPNQGYGYPNPKALIANIGLDFTRITQYFLINTGGKKNIIIPLIIAYIIALYLEVGDFQKLKKLAIEDEDMLRQNEKTIRQDMDDYFKKLWAARKPEDELRHAEFVRAQDEKEELRQKQEAEAETERQRIEAERLKREQKEQEEAENRRRTARKAEDELRHAEFVRMQNEKEELRQKQEAEAEAEQQRIKAERLKREQKEQEEADDDRRTEANRRQNLQDRLTQPLMIEEAPDKLIYDEGNKCRNCHKQYFDPQALHCGHIFCHDCVDPTSNTCPTCKKPFIHLWPIEIPSPLDAVD
ncbi:MAG: hypothetical protein WC365_02885 [Candidatus Babeliales bacterium]|jgi:hypothetical protein